MRHIDLGINKPTDEWLAESDRLTNELIALHEAGDVAGRNQLIDKNAKHWGALKRWLLKQSHDKCWFSEAREIYSHMDVEHFRPKTEARDLKGMARDGYWWLAFDYRNFRVCGNVGNRKKGGFFPLQEGSLVSTYGNRCEESEVPYLLDPADAADVGLLAFDEEGKAIATPGVSDWEELRVDETIKRLKLNEHEALSEARRRVWQRVSLEIALYDEARTRCAGGRNPAAKMKAKGHLLNIKEMTREEAELSSVATWCVLFKNDPQLSKLVA